MQRKFHDCAEHDDQRDVRKFERFDDVWHGTSHIICVPRKRDYRPQREIYLLNNQKQSRTYIENGEAAALDEKVEHSANCEEISYKRSRKHKKIVVLSLYNENVF